MTRPRRPRVDSDTISDTAWALLTDQPVLAETEADRFELFYLSAVDRRTKGIKPCLRDLWELHREAIVAEWAVMNPGTRPSCWWAWDAPRQPVGTHEGCFWDGQLPQPRQRIGGVGSLRCDHLAYVPTFHFGIPAGWVTIGDLETFGPGFRGVPISAADPPRFEAQATYLERFALLLPGEAKRLKPADFKPEVVRP